MVGIIIGIDPGIQGGICAIEGSRIVLIQKSPRIKLNRKWTFDGCEMSKILRSLLHLDPKVYIEKVGSMPKQGVTSSFNFGQGYGAWQGMFYALEIPFEFVTPQAWKKKVLAGTDKSKGAAILKAKQLFPKIDLKPGRLITDHDGMADALCIAVFGGTKTWR